MYPPAGEPSAKPELEVPERAIYMVFLTTFIDTLAATISTPVMPFYAKLFDASNQEIGFLFTAWAACSTFFAPILGRLSDKYGRRPILITALLGAGIANICQGSSFYAIEWFGQRVAFYIFGFFRGFSGVFAAIGTVTSVYIQDVVPRPLLPDYMAKSGVVGPLAFTFGPGLGGGLATIGGNQFPVMVDGIITVFSAFLVMSYLPETPAFLRLKSSRERSMQADSKSTDVEEVKVGWQVYILSAASFCGGLTMSAMVSMMALYLKEKYHLSVLQVTYVMVGNAVTMVLTGMFISVRVKNLLGLRGAIIAANLFGGCMYIFMSQCRPLGLPVWYFVVGVWLNAVQSSVANASTGALISEFTSPTNRGKVNSMFQFWTNLGRMIGPTFYGFIADKKVQYLDINSVWLIAGIALLMKSLLTSFAKASKEDPKDAKLPENESLYGEKWQDEQGSPEDQAAMGKFVVNLLTKGHYKWLSRRSQVESLLVELLPELSVGSQECYEKQFHELELAAHDLKSHTCTH